MSLKSPKSKRILFYFLNRFVRCNIFSECFQKPHRAIILVVTGKKTGGEYRLNSLARFTQLLCGGRDWPQFPFNPGLPDSVTPGVDRVG